MDAIGARPEKRNRTAVEAKDGRATPARGSIEGLVAPFRDPTFVDERVYHGIDGAAYRRDIATCDQLDLMLGDGKNLGKPP